MRQWVIEPQWIALEDTVLPLFVPKAQQPQ
jgi:hypothetical protein